MFVPAVAAATPFAGVDATLDGKPAHVAVDNGIVKVDGQIVATLGSPASASVEAGDVPGRGPTILVTLGGREAVALEKHGTWKQLFRVPIGPADEDGDYGVAIALLPNGLTRYQTRPGLARCDGKPALFFAEGWDGAKFSRLGNQADLVEPNAPAITAHADATAAPVPLLYQVRVASREPGAGGVADLVPPVELVDGNPATAWTDDRARARGQFFTFAPVGDTRAAELRFVVAAHGAEPQSIAIVGAHDAYRIALPKAPPGTALVAMLPEPMKGCVTAVIGDVDPHAAIAELEIFAEGERAGGAEATLAGLVVSGADGAQRAAQALAHRGAAAVTALDAALASAKDAPARARVLDAIVATGDASAGPVLAKAARTLRLRDQDLASLLAALGKLGQLQDLALLAASSDLDLAARAVAVNAIANAPGDHAALLVPLAGEGPRDLRHAVIDALSNVPIAELAAPAKSANDAAAAGDLLRAITRRGHAVATERAAALAALEELAPDAADYERRYRIVDGLATIGDAAALAQLSAMLRALPAGAERAALGQVAAHGLAGAPRSDGLSLIVELAHDADPGVRRAALSAFVGTAWQEADQIDRVLESALQSDTWPELRRQAAEVLGNRCARPGPARALALSVGRDPELEVRDGALVALVQCKAPGTAALLATVWDDEKLPLQLRQRAVELAAALEDPALGAKLVGKLASWRGAAMQSPEALALAQSAAYSIGRLAPPGAAEALLAALGDSAYPEIVAAAASGLGMLGPKCPTEARAQLRALSQNEEQQIALAAGRAVAQCGR